MAAVSVGTIGADLVTNVTGVAAAMTATAAQVTALGHLLSIIGDRHGVDLAGAMKLLSDTDKQALSLI